MVERAQHQIGYLERKHRKLLNALIQVERHLCRSNWEALRAALYVWIPSVRQQFAQQEAELEKLHYPDLEEHKKAHYLFVEELFALQDLVVKVHPDEVLASKVFAQLSRNLFVHIHTKDYQATEFLGKLRK